MNSSFTGPNSSSSIGPMKPAEQEVFLSEPLPLKIFRFVIYAIIILFALVGNVAVCIISRRNRRLQTSTYCFITNLAMSDVGSILCLPFLLPEHFIGNWFMGEAMCKLLKPSVFLFNFVTTNTLVAIASDRFRAVVFPFVIRPSTSETRLILALLWLVAFVFALPSYGAATVISYGAEDNYCLDIFSDDEEKDVYYRRIYSIAVFIIHNLLPVLTISALYLKITATLKHFRLLPLSLKFRRSSLGSTPNASPSSSVTNVNKLNMNPAGALRRREMERKFLKMLMIVLLVYVLCYVPFQTFYLIYEFTPELENFRYIQVLTDYLYLIVWLPNALNPVCYGCLNEHYKRAFKSLIFGPRKYVRSLRSRQSIHSIFLSNVPNTRRATNL